MSLEETKCNINIIAFIYNSYFSVLNTSLWEPCSICYVKQKVYFLFQIPENATNSEHWDLQEVVDANLYKTDNPLYNAIEGQPNTNWIYCTIKSKTIYFDCLMAVLMMGYFYQQLNRPSATLE